MLRTARGRWYLWLVLLSVAGMVAPVVWIVSNELHSSPTGDAFYFHEQASLIASGAGWFISPFPYLFHHAVVQSGQHPPLWILVLALADTLGIKSYPSQLLAACIIGAGAVFVTGLAAREAAGPRAGLLAAAIAAVYPNYWINYGLGLSETLVLLLVAAVVLVSLLFWQRPSPARAVALGFLCALAALTRAEQVLLLVLVLVPLALLLRGVAFRRRVLYVMLGLVTAIVTIAPWVGFNLSRFNDNTIFSTDSGTTLAMSNCEYVYSGPNIGRGVFRCLKSRPTTQPVTQAPSPAVPVDESVQDGRYRKKALTFVKAHLSAVPRVMAARAAREFGLFDPVKEMQIEHAVNRRPVAIADVGLAMYYVLVIGAVFGAVQLRRRRVTLVPFVGILVELILTAMLTFGQTRYRAPFEVVLVVLSAVAIDALLAQRTLRKARVRTDGGDVTASTVGGLIREGVPQG
jgi:hypothetical protein